MPRVTTSAAVEQDAADLYDAATDFIRLYQFRDRNTATRFDLTIVQAYVLERLTHSGGLGLLELAAALRLDKSTTSRIVSGMVRHGLVTQSRDMQDQRARRIAATTEGRRRYANLRRAIVKANVELLASYAANERQAIISILRQLVVRAG